MRPGLIRLTIAAVVQFLAPAAFAQPAMSSSAQSMTVIGGNSYARDCYTSASVVSRIHTESVSGVATCTRAIEYGRLSTRDLLATYVNRGILYVAKNEFDRAASDYDTAVKLKPPTGEVYVNRGNLSFLKKSYTDAISEYGKAVDLGMDKIQVAYYNRAIVQERLRDFDAAEADYRRAIEADQDWFMPKAKLDSLLRATGKLPALNQN